MLKLPKLVFDAWKRTVPKGGDQTADFYLEGGTWGVVGGEDSFMLIPKTKISDKI
jgi:hypothetical protein